MASMTLSLLCWNDGTFVDAASKGVHVLRASSPSVGCAVLRHVAVEGRSVVDVGDVVLHRVGTIRGTPWSRERVLPQRGRR